jgi:ribose transport system substrate-binding protein
MKKQIAMLTALATLTMAVAPISVLADEEKVDIAVVSISAADSNNVRYIKGLEDGAEQYGYEVSVLDADGSTDKANSAFANFVSRGADVIVDMVFPATSIATGLKSAEDAGIPVVTWGGGMADGVWYTNGSGGPTATDVIKKMIEDMDGEGELLALTYHEGQVARDREAILDELLADYPDIEVTKNEVNIPGTLQNAMEYANAWLASRPADGTNYAVWGSWDDPALGAISTLKQMGRTDVKVYGQNGNADALQAILDGTMTATSWQSGYDEGIAAMHEILEKGEEFEKTEEVVPVVVVTADNIEKFIEEHPETMENVQ